MVTAIGFNWHAFAIITPLWIQFGIQLWCMRVPAIDLLCYLSWLRDLSISSFVRSLLHLTISCMGSHELASAFEFLFKMSLIKIVA